MLFRSDTQAIVFATAEAPQRKQLAEQGGFPVATSTRELTELIEATQSSQVVVVPASTGRDLTAITQVAQTLTWLKSSGFAPQLLLAAPIFNDTYTIAYLRKRIRSATQRGSDAIAFVAQAVDPFADAELFRRVRLAEQYSEKIQVALCFDAKLPTKADVFPTVEQTAHTLEKLGATRVEIAKRLDLIDPHAWAFTWVVDWPLFESADEATAAGDVAVGSGAWTASHHAFTEIGRAHV